MAEGNNKGVWWFWIVVAIAGFAWYQDATRVVLTKDKLDAEEAGYQEEFNEVIVGASEAAHQLYGASEDARKHRQLLDETKVKPAVDQMAASYTQLRKLGQDYAPRLAQTLPPPALTAMHQHLERFLQRVKDTQAAEDIAAESLPFWQTVQTVKAEIEKRPAQAKETTPLYFQIDCGGGARLNPLTGEFSVRLLDAVPGGAFVPAGQGPSGVKRLIVRANNRFRYFSLDRPFNVFVPTDYGVNLSTERRAGGDTLLVEVISRQ